MAKGTNRVQYLASAGYVTGQKHTLWDFIYKVSATKDPLYSIGDRVALPDGREYVYGRCITTSGIVSGQGCEIVAVGVADYTAITVAQAVGDRQLTQPAATHDAFAIDELRGGYVVIYDGISNDIQFRGIIGNDATAADVAFVIYLDGPLTEAIVANTSAVEAFQNPYNNLRLATTTNYAIAGVGAVKVSGTGLSASNPKYFWVQVKGPAWIAPHASASVNDRDIGSYWHKDGYIYDTEATIMAGTTLPALQKSQYAGHRIEGTQGTRGPLFMLQG
jgi:hypothetical protein